MDNAYIHFVYAQNLVDHHKLMFNFQSESGVGTTSLLWIALLALGYSLGIPLHLTAKILGITTLVSLGVGLFALLNAKLPHHWSWICCLGVIFSGNRLWLPSVGWKLSYF